MRTSSIDRTKMRRIRMGHPIDSKGILLDVRTSNTPRIKMHIMRMGPTY
jgi:hypothetical protein